MPDPISASNERFESIKRTNPYGAEYWSARDLMPLLGYDQWRRFEDAIDRAQELCEIGNQDVDQHFRESGMRVTIGMGVVREITDYRLTPYAVRLILACSDLRKPEIAQMMACISLAAIHPTLDYSTIDHILHMPISPNLEVTKEQRTIGTIQRAFKHLRSVRQYRVAPYLIDLYFPDRKIAVECDEYGHQQYPQRGEDERQHSIEWALRCIFVRFNPHIPDFHVGDVINQIMLMIYA